ncbi:MAG: tetratricopeptide repeat protein [Acidobacteriota bacterium]
MAKRAISKWAVFVFLLAIIVSMVPAAVAKVYWFKGKHHFSLGQYQQAVDDYQYAIRLRPSFARAYVELGDAYRGLGQYAQAEEAFKKASSLEDESCASCGLGLTYYKLGRYEYAEKAFKRSIELNRNDICGYDQAGRMYYDLGKYSQAIAIFEQEVKLQPNAPAYLYLGNAYAYSEHFNAAIQAYEKALLLQPNEEMAYVQLGVAYGHLRRHQEAVEAYRRAIRIDPKNEKAHYSLVLAFLALHDTMAARQEYETLRLINAKMATEVFKHSPSLQGQESVREKLYLVPFSNFSTPSLSELVTYYKMKSGISIVTLPRLPLNSSTFDSDRHQVIAEELMEEIRQTYPKLAADPNAIIVGVTDMDMYIREKNWRFAFSYNTEGRFAVVSSARMDPSNLRQPANSELLFSRLRKMIMKNIGILYYHMWPINNPKSVLYNNIMGVEELDNMGEDF